MKKKYLTRTELKNLGKILMKRSIDYHEFIVQDSEGALHILDGIDSIPEGAFEGFEGPLAVILPSSLKSIGKNAFKGCLGLNRIEIPESVEFIPDGCFENCRNLTEVILPQGLVRIGKSAFHGCTWLFHINLPRSLEVIDDCAFLACRSLGTIEFGPNLKKVGWQAFDECHIYKLHIAEYAQFFPKYCYIFTRTPIISIAVDPRNEEYEDAGCNVIMEKETGRVICGSVNSRIPENATSIDVGAFRTAPENLDIPSSVKRIASKAFMSSRSKYFIQDGVEVIDDVAFIPDDKEDSTNVVFIPPSVRSIGSQISSVEFHLYDESPYYRYDSAGQNIISKDDGTLVWGRLLQGIPEGVSDVVAFLDRYPGYTRLTIPESVAHVSDGIYLRGYIESIVVSRGTKIDCYYDETEFELEVIVPLGVDGSGIKMTYTFPQGTPVKTIREYLGEDLLEEPAE